MIKNGWVGWKVVSLNSGALRVFVCKIYIKYVQLLAFIIQNEINACERDILGSMNKRCTRLLTCLRPAFGAVLAEH